MKTNKAIKKEPVLTFEGGKASRIDEFEQLTRSTMSCLLWENEFYEDGVSIAERIHTLIDSCIKKGLYDHVIELLKKVKFDMRLRHCPLWMIVGIYKAGKTVSKDLIVSILTRPDDAGELISLYRKENVKAPLPNAFKKGISKAFQTFDEYQLSKWNKDANYKLVDIINLCHTKPTEAINKLMNGTLETPKTWEVMLSAAGSDVQKKKAAWEELISTDKLPDMAFLKNIAGMDKVGVGHDVICNRIKTIKNQKLLPIDFIRAGTMNPEFENEIEKKFLQQFSKEKLPGRTLFLIDVSGSMFPFYEKINRFSYASALAMIGREMYEDVIIKSFSNSIVTVPNRRGFALRDAISGSQIHSCTYMWEAIKQCIEEETFDRMIVITDEQTSDIQGSIKPSVPSYIINVAPYQTGVGYNNGFIHINGMSDKVFDYIHEIEQMNDK